ncbi:MAG: rhodanese-like domain-containing protein [Methylohalobius sp.]|nr:rhodanese-like domain-containing protein [Methylohalobius sp.]
MDRLFEFIGNHLYLALAFAASTALLLHNLLESLLRKYKVATPLEAVMLINQEDAVVVDVRQPHEWAKGHIVGARLIPLGELDKRLADLDDAKHKPVIVTCQSGTRSPAACKKLLQAGFAKVYLLKNGMTAWEDASLPIVKPKPS